MILVIPMMSHPLALVSFVLRLSNLPNGLMLRCRQSHNSGSRWRKRFLPSLAPFLTLTVTFKVLSAPPFLTRPCVLPWVMNGNGQRKGQSSALMLLIVLLMTLIMIKKLLMTGQPCVTRLRVF